MEGYKLLSRALRLAAELREQINATGCFVCSAWKRCCRRMCATTACGWTHQADRGYFRQRL